MNRLLPTGAIALAAMIGVAACSGASGAALGSQAPVATAPAVSPSPSPTGPAVTPRPSPANASPSPATSPDPDIEPDAAKSIHVNLSNALGDDVSIDIQDESGHVVSARSGTPGDGASVAWRELKAENVDARTLRFTWTGMPGDDRLGFYVSEDGKVALALQDERDGDSIAFDRVLIVTFDRPVDAATLTLGVQDGLDTDG